MPKKPPVKLTKAEKLALQKEQERKTRKAATDKARRERIKAKAIAEAYHAIQNDKILPAVNKLLSDQSAMQAREDHEMTHPDDRQAMQNAAKEVTIAYENKKCFVTSDGAIHSKPKPSLYARLCTWLSRHFPPRADRRVGKYKGDGA